MEGLLDNAFFSITCPKCGAQMKAKGNDTFECPYCGYKIMAFGLTKCDTICFRYRIPEYTREFLNKEEMQYFEEQRDINVAHHFGEYLLEKGYIDSKTISDFTTEGEQILFTLKIIKPEKEASNIEVAEIDKNGKIAFRKEKIRKVAV